MLYHHVYIGRFLGNVTADRRAQPGVRKHSQHIAKLPRCDGFAVPLTTLIPKARDINIFTHHGVHSLRKKRTGIDLRQIFSSL